MLTQFSVFLASTSPAHAGIIEVAVSRSGSVGALKGHPPVLNVHLSGRIYRNDGGRTASREPKVTTS